MSQPSSPSCLRSNPVDRMRLGGAAVARTACRIRTHPIDEGTADRALHGDREFRPGQVLPPFLRFRDRGGLVLEGLSYVSSWVDPEFGRSFQVMEASARPSCTGGWRTGSTLAGSKSFPSARLRRRRRWPAAPSG
jgi:hypothetical protein